MKIEVIDLAGAEGACERCNVPLRVAGGRNVEARMLRLAKTQKGYCIDCAVRAWFYCMRDTFRDLRPEDLRLPHVQQQTALVMKAAGADARPEEITWERVIANWDLPLRGAQRGPAR